MSMLRPSKFAFLLLAPAFAVVIASLASCDSNRSSPTPAPSRSTSGPSTTPIQEPNRKETSRVSVSAAEFATLSTRLSEPSSEFISDNYVSNETSYLQVADQLARQALPAGVYLGVGPEQNFSYIALSKPSLAFILDIRRNNLLLHLFYKSLFELAPTRAHFIALLFSRPLRAERARAPDTSENEASVDDLLAQARLSAPSKQMFETTHQSVLNQLRKSPALTLSDTDMEELMRAHRAFFEGQLELTFTLRRDSARRYPSYAKLLTMKDTKGKARGFLGSEAAYQFVRALQVDNRIIPVVGDFAGPHALKSIASEIRRRNLTTSVFYTSNVEQYLLDSKHTWLAWLKNLRTLPAQESSLLVRAYLDQGRRHPAQLPGHRTATLLFNLAKARASDPSKPPSFWHLTTTFQRQPD